MGAWFWVSSSFGLWVLGSWLSSLYNLCKPAKQIPTRDCFLDIAYSSAHSTFDGGRDNVSCVPNATLISSKKVVPLLL